MDLGEHPDISEQHVDGLLRRAREGEREAINALLEVHRFRLKRMVRCRLDPRLYGRIDDSDVIQEAYLEVSRRIADYFHEPHIPFYLWLRTAVGYKLKELHRRHLGVKARSVLREVSVYGGNLPGASTAILAQQLMGRLSTPSKVASRAEMKLHLQEALNQMEPLDRETIALRHFEQMSNREAAVALKISEAAASSRYLRAMKALRKRLKPYADLFE